MGKVTLSYWGTAKWCRVVSLTHSLTVARLSAPRLRLGCSQVYSSRWFRRSCMVLFADHTWPLPLLSFPTPTPTPLLCSSLSSLLSLALSLSVFHRFFLFASSSCLVVIFCLLVLLPSCLSLPYLPLHHAPPSLIASSPMATSTAPTPGVRTHFKTPEGRYNLSRDKTHPSTIPHYSLAAKVIAQVTLAHLKEKPTQSSSASSGNSSTAGGVRFTAARLLGAGNGSRSLGFGGGNGFTNRLSGSSKSPTASNAGGAVGLSNGPLTSSYDGEGTYLIFNVGDAIFISDYHSQDKEPIKAIQFSGANPVCHHFDDDTKDGNDLLIGLSTGDVYTASLRQQLQDSGKKLVGAMHFNKDGSINSSRCTAVLHVPNVEGLFVAAHADGNLFVYDKTKDGSGDAPFPPIKDVAQFHVAHARSSKSNPIARWHVCQGSINGIAFSRDGAYLATVGRDGYLRVFDYAKETLVCGCKSYFGALLCCSWSPDGKYILTGGEDDLVQVWSMEDQAVVAWGEGHNSWVSVVAFDPYWEAPTPDTGAGDVTTYRFGSVGQDTQLLLWDLSMDEVVVPLRMAPVSGGSPSVVSTTTPQSAGWDGAPVHSAGGPLRLAPARKEVPKLAPVMAHRVHAEPLSGLLFSKDAIVTACHEGHLKIWDRPGNSDTLPIPTPEVSATAAVKDKLLTPGKGGLSHLKQ